MRKSSRRRISPALRHRARDLAEDNGLGPFDFRNNKELKVVMSAGARQRTCRELRCTKQIPVECLL